MIQITDSRVIMAANVRESRDARLGPAGGESTDRGSQRKSGAGSAGSGDAAAQGPVMVGAVSMDSRHDRRRTEMKIDNAERKLERYEGKLMYLWHIVATVSSMEGTVQVKNCKVLAPNFLDAAELIKMELVSDGYVEVFEFHSKGPKGGKKYTSMGYESCIGRHLLGAR